MPADGLDAIRDRLSKGAVPVDELRRLLKHRAAVVRAETAEALAKKGDFESLEPLLRDPEPGLRLKAVELLSKATDSAAAFRLIGALRHADPDVRRATFEVALAWKGERREKLLLVALDDRDPRRRRRALDELRTPEAIARALKDDALRDRARELLAHIPDDHLLAAIGGPEDAAARELLRSRGAQVVPLLVARLGSEKDALAALDLLLEIDRKAEATLARAWPRLATEARLRALDRLPGLAPAAAVDPDPRVRRAAVRALLRGGDWDPAWAAYLRTPPGTDGWTEGDLVDIASRLGDERSVGLEELAEALRGPAPAVRREAAVALRKRGAFELLAAQADGDDPFVVREAGFALAEKNDPRAPIPLIRAQREARGAARKARELLKRYPETQSMAFVFAGLRHARGSVRLWAAEKLEGTDDPAAVDMLLGLLGDPSAEIQHAAVRALTKFAAEPRISDRLMACLEYGDVSVRQAAVEALGEAKVAAAVPALVKLLTNPFLRARAEAALKLIGDRRGYLAVMRRKRRDAHVGRERDKVRTMNRRRR